MINALYKTAALRLLAAAALISGALATATYFFEIERIDQVTTEVAAQEARSFRLMNEDVFANNSRLSEAEIASRLMVFLTAHASSPDGHFLIAEVYDAGRHSLGEASQRVAAEVEQALSVNEHQFPNDGQPWYDKSTVKGQLFIRVVVPLVHRTQNHDPHQEPGSAISLDGFFEGVYHVSEERLTSIRRNLITNVLLVVGVVLCTTLFLVPVILGVNRALVSLSQRLLRANIETLEVLGNAVAMRDSDTGAHNYRVTIFALRLAEAVGLPPAQVRQLIKGAFLHDVGKIGISDTILLKPGRLTAEEFTIMKQHVAHGLKIVTQSAWLQDATDVVLYHHEKVDGSGYLQGLKGGEIPLTARIFAIADVFDALVSRRPYKEPQSFDQALATIQQGAGSHFDPVLVTAFAQIARPLYDSFAGQDEGVAERVVHELTSRYFNVIEG